MNVENRIDNIQQAELHLDEATRHLVAYIQRHVALAGSQRMLCARLNIPYASLNSTLQRGGILGLRKLAYRIQAGLAAHSKK